jgi:hypothetical protein
MQLFISNETMLPLLALDIFGQFRLSFLYAGI